MIHTLRSDLWPNSTNYITSAYKHRGNIFPSRLMYDLVHWIQSLMWHDSQSEIWRVTWFSEPGLVCLLEFTGMLFDMWPVWNDIVRPSKRGKKAGREPENGGGGSLTSCTVFINGTLQSDFFGIFSSASIDLWVSRTSIWSVKECESSSLSCTFCWNLFL